MWNQDSRTQRVIPDFKPLRRQRKVLDFHRLWNWYSSKLHLDLQGDKEASAYTWLKETSMYLLY